MQVKDFLKELTDDNKIRIEKIGSGNWYWGFASDDRRQKENVLDNLRIEKERLMNAIGEIETSIAQETVKRQDDVDDVLEEVDADAAKGCLTSVHDCLTKQLLGLEKELTEYKDNDPTEIEKTREGIKLLREGIEKWTDNIMSLEGYIFEKLARNRGDLAIFQQEFYGVEYEEGEGLREASLSNI
jgi:predicted  nucleic acid-binding Zn-ribbon protein